MKKTTTKTPASRQLPIRLDEESQAALQRLVDRLKEPNQSQIIRWAIKHFDREVIFDVDRKGVPIVPPPEGSSGNPSIPTVGSPKMAGGRPR